MVTELQFIAVTVFLIWGLAASVCGLLKHDVNDECADLDDRYGVSRTKRHSRSAES